ASGRRHRRRSRKPRSTNSAASCSIPILPRRCSRICRQLRISIGRLTSSDCAPGSPPRRLPFAEDRAMTATASSIAATAAPASSARLLQRAEPFLYVLPAVLFVGFFLLYPMVLTLWRSFTRFDGITAPVFIGLGNYWELFRDPHFLRSLANTLIWTVASVLF